MRRTRRALLGTLGTATALCAGCLDRAGGGEPTDADATDTATGTDTTTDEPTDTPTTTDPTDTPGTPPRNPVSDVPCPSFSDSADRTTCWPNGDLDGEPLYMDASSVAFEPSPGDGSVETIEFVLHNGSSAAFGLNPYDWALYRRTDDDWTFVAPAASVEPWYTVESGGTYTWRLAVEEHPSGTSEDSMALVQDLRDGVFAFQVTGALGEASDDPTRMECVVLFAVSRQ